MSARWMRLGFVGVGASLLAACAGEQVWLGQAQLGLDDCEGAQCADAGAMQPPVTPPSIAPPTLPPATPGSPPLEEVVTLDRCKVPVSAELSFEQRISEECGDETASTCLFEAKTLHPTADGGAWIVGGGAVPATDSPLTARRWLLRYDASGRVRCKVEVPAMRLNVLAVDDGGNAWISQKYRESEVQRFDGDCQPLGGSLTRLNEVKAMANVPGQGVVIVNGNEDQTVTLYDHDGQARWSQPGTGEFHVSLATAASSALVLGTTQRRGAAGAITIRAIDASGNTRWQAATQAHVFWPGFSNGQASSSDQQGNLLLAFTPSDALGAIEHTYFADVESIDPSGQTRWALRVESSLSPTVAVAQGGEVYVAGREESVRSPRANVLVISQDGSSCRQLRSDGPGMLSKLTFSPSGHLWYATHFEFGRFGPLP